MRWFNSIMHCVTERMSIDLGFWYRNVAIGCTVAIGVLSLIPDAGMLKINTRNILEPDHMIAYVFLTIFWFLAWGKRFPPVLIAIGAIGYGCILELLQYVIPGRGLEWLDMVANGVGVLLGGALMMTLQRFATRKA